VRTTRNFCAVAVAMWLSGCASHAPSTETYIEQGQAKLMPETVVVGSGTPSVITAYVSVAGERKGIAVLAAECNDGVGSIKLTDEPGDLGFREVSFCSWRQTSRPAIYNAVRNSAPKNAREAARLAIIVFPLRALRAQQRGVRQITATQCPEFENLCPTPGRRGTHGLKRG